MKSKIHSWVFIQNVVDQLAIIHYDYTLLSRVFKMTVGSQIGHAIIFYTKDRQGTKLMWTLVIFELIDYDFTLLLHNSKLIVGFFLGLCYNFLHQKRARHYIDVDGSHS